MTFEWHLSKIVTKKLMHIHFSSLQFCSNATSLVSTTLTPEAQRLHATQLPQHAIPVQL